MQIDRWNEIKDGTFSEKALRKKIEKRGFHVSRYTYPPGTFFPEHTHEIDKIDGVVSGRFRMTTKDGEVILEAGDCLSVPRGTVHAAEVVGEEPVVSLDATKS
jgi:quercetin dioxygenase-like cupin family protein